MEVEVNSTIEKTIGEDVVTVIIEPDRATSRIRGDRQDVTVQDSYDLSPSRTRLTVDYELPLSITAGLFVDVENLQTFYNTLNGEVGVLQNTTYTKDETGQLITNLEGFYVQDTDLQAKVVVLDFSQAKITPSGASFQEINDRVVEFEANAASYTQDIQIQANNYGSAVSRVETLEASSGDITVELKNSAAVAAGGFMEYDGSTTPIPIGVWKKVGTDPDDEYFQYVGGLIGPGADGWIALDRDTFLATDTQYMHNRNVTFSSAVDASPPSSPEIGDYWIVTDVFYDTNENKKKVREWDGSTWNDLSEAIAGAMMAGWMGAASSLVKGPDGEITGWQYSDGSASGSEFIISADTFKVVAANQTGGIQNPFTVNATSGTITLNGAVTFGSGSAVDTLEESVYYTGTTEIDGGKIRADTITADEIATNTITTSQILTSDITNNNLIVQGNITGVGTVTAGTFDGTTFKGNNYFLKTGANKPAYPIITRYNTGTSVISDASYDVIYLGFCGVDAGITFSNKRVIEGTGTQIYLANTVDHNLTTISDKNLVLRCTNSTSAPMAVDVWLSEGATEEWATPTMRYSSGWKNTPAGTSSVNFMVGGFRFTLERDQVGYPCLFVDKVNYSSGLTHAGFYIFEIWFNSSTSYTATLYQQACTVVNHYN